MMRTGFIRFFSLCSLLMGILGCPASPPAGIPAPVSELLSVGAPDSRGLVFVSGDPGAVNPGAQVTATNVTETASKSLLEGLLISVVHAGESAPPAFITTVTADSEGSFNLFLNADFGDVIEVVQTVEGQTSDATGLVVSGETIFLGVPLEDVAVTPMGIVHVSGNDETSGIIFDLNFAESPLLSLPEPLCEGFERGITRLAFDERSLSGFVIAPELNALFSFPLDTCLPFSLDVPNPPLDVTSDPIFGGVLVSVEAPSGQPNILSFIQDGPSSFCNIEIVHPQGLNHVATPFLAMGPSIYAFAVSQFADGSLWATRLNIGGQTGGPCAGRQLANVLLPAGTLAGGLASIDDAQAIISDFNGDQVFIVDFTDNSITPVPVGDGPRGVAADAGNLQRAYVVNMDDNSLSLIDLNDFSVDTIVSVGLMPTEIALLPGGTQAVILSSSDQAVVLLGLNF